MVAAHLEFLVEELSMEAFLRGLLPRILPQDRSFAIHPFQGKQDLLGKLEPRLRAYASWLPQDRRSLGRSLPYRQQKDSNDVTV